MVSIKRDHHQRDGSLDHSGMFSDNELRMKSHDGDAISDNSNNLGQSFLSGESSPSRLANRVSENLKPKAAQEAAKETSATATQPAIPRVKVFLMTTGDRYQQYYMEAEGPTIYFYRLTRGEKGTISQNLPNTHITSIDSAEKKVLCKSRRHFGFTLSNE